MRTLRTVMTTASLSTILWRAEARFALPGASAARSRGPSSVAAARLHHRRSPSSFYHSSRRDGAVDCPCLAFQGIGFPRLQRRPIATAFPRNGTEKSPRKVATSTHHPLLQQSTSSTSQAEGAVLPEPTQDSKTKPIPTFLLAGFLGSGKTSTLKHLLENNSNIKIGTIVNDVAAVNIDAKLIANSATADVSSSATRDDDLETYAEGVVELQNGCACCSLADELFTSVMRLTQGGKRELDAIVVELSGVADPVAVRDNWKQAELDGHPATQLAALSRTITLVDACTFGTDWMTWDKAGERSAWTHETDGIQASIKNVPELLAEQVEAADLLLVNKIDLAGKDQVMMATAVARGLNKEASVMEVEFGRVGVRDLLGKMMLDEEEEIEQHSHGHEHSHGHSSEHDHHHEESSKEHPSHDHNHNHSPKDDHDEVSSSHSHSHEHDAAECNDPSHSHSHDHTNSECDDPDCTDTAHSHSHNHKDQAENHLGITSFVYSASIPFNSQRLLELLNRWPVPIKDSLDIGTAGTNNGEEDLLPGQHEAFVGVLRSKGFCWMSPTQWSTAVPGNDVWRHETAMFWSHAGKHFGITAAGKWWGCLSKEQIKPYFVNNMEEYDRIMKEDWVSEEWGDRRQELVFIGIDIDEEEIRAALDECLCTEEEVDEYRASLKSYLKDLP